MSKEVEIEIENPFIVLFLVLGLPGGLVQKKNTSDKSQVQELF